MCNMGKQYPPPRSRNENRKCLHGAWHFVNATLMGFSDNGSALKRGGAEALQSQARGHNTTLNQPLAGPKKLDRRRSFPSIRPLAPFTFVPLLLLRHGLKPEVRFRCPFLLGQEPRTRRTPWPGATKPGEPAAPQHPRPAPAAVAP